VSTERLDSLLGAVAEVADLAAGTAMRWFGQHVAVETKGDGSPVTIADRTAEEVARAWIAERFPRDGVQGEEFPPIRPEAKRQWIIDPIDGTKAFVRGVPLITVLFMANTMLPLFLPDNISVDKLLRALVGIGLFASAYMAEVVRGGLQAMPRGQYEAADAIGLSFWQKMRLIILPQALTITIPSQVNTFIGLFKDTTLVVVIGVFDFFTTLRAALGDPNWLGFPTEAYLFAASVYCVLCFAMSRYSQSLEKTLRPETR
jgi:ABC-type amino acid transport system permease subunit